MSKLIKYCLVLLLALAFASPALGDQAADDKAAADEAAIIAVMARIDSGELTVEQALVLALEQDISFSVIVAACESRLIPLSAIITAAASAGISSEVALAKMADAGVSAEKMSEAITTAAGTTPTTGDDSPGLGYTQTETTQVPAVVPVTTNPGNTLTPNTVSPSTL